MKKLKYFTYFLFLFFVLFSCQNQHTAKETNKEFKVDFSTFTLTNGLQVIFHIDKSDPVVAVAMTSHVGSAREKENKTGFAHLFEHLLFLESENLGKGGLDKMSARIGGAGANGFTSLDITSYFQTVPSDALEKMIWAEADKIGFFINTVTDPVLSKEKQVVKNEKRQRVDNEPYGHTQFVIDQNLYPKGHPYHWQVIGSLEDLQNATLQDVKDFYKQWYVPNNVTLVIAGDFDPTQAKAWVEKYFGEIKRGTTIPPIEKKPVVLSETKKLYHEDNFALLPELTLAWPSVYQYHPDSYPLSVLASFLSEGKKAPLYRVLVEDKQLTSSVQMNNYDSELAGQLMLSIRGFEKVDLNKVQIGIHEAFRKFEKEGISQDDLERIKAVQEVNFYNNLSSTLGKAFQLGQYQLFTNDAGFIEKDIQHILSVTREDVMRVYKKYVQGKHYIATSFVPKGQTHLILKDSKQANVVEEKIVDGAEEEFNLTEAASYTKTASSFDRSIEPPYGKSPQITAPKVWEEKTANGMKVYGIENNEVPLVQFNLAIKSGLLLEDSAKVGVSNLLAELLTKGTKNKTPQQLEEAIEKLGASLEVSASNEYITLSGSTLARNYAPTMALVQEIILEPRWDEKELMLAKQKVLSQLKEQEANPNDIADNQFKVLIYSKEHILSNNLLGRQASVANIEMSDLKEYYSSKLSPSLAALHVVGAVEKGDVLHSLSELSKQWKMVQVTIPTYPMPVAPKESKVYFYDVPGAKQSVIRFGYPALSATSPDYYPSQVMNYILGGGGFASQLTQQLREGKGYTYFINSDFTGTTIPGPFMISSSVRSNITFESASLIKRILEQYGHNYNEQDLEVTKSFLTKSNARAFETLDSKLTMLNNISAYGWPYDYAKQRQQLVKDMNVEKIKGLAMKYINPNNMYYLVVGDADTQLKRLNKLGFGSPILLNTTEQRLSLK